MGGRASDFLNRAQEYHKYTKHTCTGFTRELKNVLLLSKVQTNIRYVIMIKVRASPVFESLHNLEYAVDMN